MFESGKFKRYVNDTAEKRYEELNSIFPFTAARDSLHEDEIHHVCPKVEEEFLADRFYHFEGRDAYLLLQKNITVPHMREGRNIVGIFDFGVTYPGNNNGFESVLYIDGRIYQGVDSNHKEVFLDEFAGKEITLTFILWTGINEGRHEILHHMLRQADVGYLNKEIDQFYYLSRAVAETIDFLPQADVCKSELIRILEDSYQLVRWEVEDYTDSVHTALLFLEQELQKMKTQSPYTVHCIGHTHIDVAWLWRLKHTHEKALRSFSTVMRNMERYEDYTFIQSQPQLYAFVKQDDPDLYAQMKKRIDEGRWITDGAMWLEADCNISSGEALARQMLYGTRYFEQEFGRTCKILWLPDVFGYSWALPQILKESGIEYFVTTKISWNQVNSMPHDLFIWRGIDGSEVTTYFINTPDEGQPADRWYATYNGFLSPETVLGTVERFKDKAYGRDMLVSFGYGDGGGGPSREMLEMKRAMKQVPGLPNIQSGSVADFLKLAEEQLTNSHQKPVWDGELYLEYHRGTYTSQAFNKKMNRKTEFAMGEIEFLSSLAMMKENDYPKELIDECWTTILRNQFHDIIPGSSIHEVYEDSRKEYKKVLSITEKLREQAVSCLREQKKGNSSFYHMGSFERNDLLFIPETKAGLSFYDQSGLPLECQKIREGYLVQVLAKPLTITSVFWKQEEQGRKDSVFHVDLNGRRVESPHYMIEWNEDGELTLLHDKDQDRHLLSNGMKLNQLMVYEDRPMNYENWDIDCYYEEKKDQFLLCKPVEIEEDGTLMLKLSFTYCFHNSTIWQNMILYKNSRRIDFETKVDWKEAYRLLKTVSQVDIRTTKASYDIQYGYVERPVHRNTSWDMARFESVGQKWADLSEADYGFSILNDCKYGYGIHENKMTLSLLKSTKSPDLYMDMGEHSFTYSFLPHSGNLVMGDTIEESVILNQPLQLMDGCVKEDKYIVRLLGKERNFQRNVIVDTIKKAEDSDDLIIRMHECRGTRMDVYLETVSDGKAMFTNIIEKEKGENIDLNEKITFRPFEIKTIRLHLDK